MKTEKFIIYASIFLSFVPSMGVGEEKIPLDSQILVDKLEAFEAQERAKYEKVVKEKTAEVIRILQSHLDRETKSGNLERAIALRKKIESLSEVASELSDSKGIRKIPEGAKAFRNSGHYLISVQRPGLSYGEASKLAGEKGGEVFAPRSERDVEMFLEIVKNIRCWVGLRYDQDKKKLIPDGQNTEPLDPEEIGLEDFGFNPSSIGREVYLATNGSGGFKLANKTPVVKDAVFAVMIYFPK